MPLASTMTMPSQAAAVRLTGPLLLLLLWVTAIRTLILVRRSLPALAGISFASTAALHFTFKSGQFEKSLLLFDDRFPSSFSRMGVKLKFIRTNHRMWALEAMTTKRARIRNTASLQETMMMYPGMECREQQQHRISSSIRPVSISNGPNWDLHCFLILL